MTIKTPEDLKKAVITGCAINDQVKTFRNSLKGKGIIRFPSVRTFTDKDPAKLSKKELKEIHAKVSKAHEDNQRIRMECEDNFIKGNPEAYYSAVLMESRVRGHDGGLNAKELEAFLKLLSPKLAQAAPVKRLNKALKDLKSTEVGFTQLMKTTQDVQYKVDKSFKGLPLQNIIYFGVLSNDHVCARKKDGTVQIFDKTGKVLKEFNPELGGNAGAIAIDKQDNIYCLSSIVKEVERKFRGRVHKQKSDVGVQCAVYSKAGKFIKKYKVEGLKFPTGARVIDENLIISSHLTGDIGIYNKESGSKVRILNGMRPCCSILDFSVNDKKQLIVANLGAFKIQTYDLNGKNLMTFGKRGRGINDFHGCCNPVSVAFLSNGAIATVEKAPTRIKIYSKEGAKQIEGIQELVDGCFYIPMIVDSKDNLYLASPKKGVVKCIAKK